MAITLKLNSGGFVCCLTRSDLELTKKKKKIPIAMKQQNYTDHKHFLKKITTTTPLNTITGSSLCERGSRTPTAEAKYLCLTGEGKKERNDLIFSVFATGASPAIVILDVSHRAA